MCRFDSARYRTWSLRLVESLENLRAMGQRSWLALLGIVVGSASVVALLSIGRSASEETMSTFKGLGSDMLVASFPGLAGPSAPLPRTLDTRPLEEGMPGRVQTAPISQYATSIRGAGEKVDAAVVGTTPALAEVMGLSMAQGRFLSPYDGKGLFVVLGAEVASALGGTAFSPYLGQRVRIGHYQFQIIGLLAPQAHNPLLPVTPDASVFVPATSMARLSSVARIGNVIVRTAPQTDLSRAAATFESLLSRQLTNREVSVQVPRQLLDSLERQARTFSWLLAGLGGISLLVAGVGVMNVMLMSVRERRREIGVRMALGARPVDIRTMFLLEAAYLSLLGAVLGALIGCAVAVAFARVCGWPVSLSVDACALGIGSSLGVGLFFGSYPAVVAARLSPAMALRDD